jgi:hypothetical protein
VFITRSVKAVVAEMAKYPSQRQLPCSAWACSALQRHAGNQETSRAHESLRQPRQSPLIAGFLIDAAMMRQATWYRIPEKYSPNAYLVSNIKIGNEALLALSCLHTTDKHQEPNHDDRNPEFFLLPS